MLDMSAKNKMQHLALHLHTYTTSVVWLALVSVNCLLGHIGSKCPKEQTAETGAGCTSVHGWAEQDGALCPLLICICFAEQGTL